ncbi:MAG: radical SAM family heme chaperone HemW [Pseudomonadota bacterium]
MTPRFGLYIHWPFCAAKCPYCDFNSHVSSAVDADRWERALRAELARVANETPDHVLSTIFFGGGTPSLMPAALVAHLIDDAQRLWRTANDVEITLEANPTSIDTEKFHAFRQAGVNRVSLGVQALNDPDLRRLGRMHSVDEALRGMEIARGTFDRVSIDLIYARQNQTAGDWERELSRALSFDLDHLSLYQLTIEPGTIFAKRHSRGQLKGLPEEGLAVELWEMTQELTTHAGLPAYEVSNHARPGAESRHNILYWTGGDWGGIGPGAHGRLTLPGGRVATETALMPEAWLSRVEQMGSGETTRRVLDTEEVVDELVLMGLRLRDGIDLAQLKSFGWQPDQRRLSELSDLGFVSESQDRLAVTETGRPLLNAVIERLLT